MACDKLSKRLDSRIKGLISKVEDIAESVALSVQVEQDRAAVALVVVQLSARGMSRSQIANVLRGAGGEWIRTEKEVRGMLDRARMHYEDCFRGNPYMLGEEEAGE